MRRAVTAALLAALLVVPAAGAKGVAKVVLVGAHGRSAELAPGDSTYLSLRAPGAEIVAHGRGGYVLVYPLLGHGTFGEPGRYYPRTRAYCSGWTLQARLCFRVADVGTARAIAARRLPLLRVAPTRAVAVVDGRTGVAVKPDVKAAFELALARRGLTLERPAACSLEFTARWSGPARRPTRFCLAPGGVWANGTLFALPAQTWSYVYYNP